jgi:hypothetical protein
MDFGLGWRELVMLAEVLAGIYLIVALMALVRLRRRSVAAPVFEPTAPSVPMDLTPVFKPVQPEQPWDHPFRTPVELGTVNLRLEDSRPNEPPASAFAATLAATELESEVRQLRADLAALRQEVTELKQSPRISPLYADAAALAHRGFDARGVAEECGISVAEAELVLAMSRDEKDFDSEVSDGADGRKQDAEY